MLLRKLFLCKLFAGLVIFAQSQTASFQPLVFTWEGALEGNKAIWKADDTLNVYRNIEGIDVTVHLVDPLKLNTTTINPSEFNDYTKTNTFYGKGNLAFQVTSTQSKQPVYLEFIFSKPVFMHSFNVYDIDMLQSATNKMSTYQDSLSFMAYNQAGLVPLTLQKLDSLPTYTIYGQSVKANFIAGVNGDVHHSNKRGAVRLKSDEAIQKFVLCHTNGSEDDGLSNSHAIKIPEFEFSELLGRIEGTVYEVTTRTPLSGSVIRLLDQNGELVINKEGFVMQVMTDETGHYSFGFLPVGQYTVVQINPPGYENAGDVDGADDNMILQTLSVSNVISLENDFFERLSAPLAANVSDLYVSRISDQSYKAEWIESPEMDTRFYTVLSSTDGENYIQQGEVQSDNQDGMKYSLSFDQPGNYSQIYVKLTQTRMDGLENLVGIRVIRSETDGVEIKVYPNPASEYLNVDLGYHPEASGYEYFLTDSSHRMISGGKATGSKRDLHIDLSGCIDGNYFLNVLTDKGKFVKQVIIRK